MIPDQSQDTDAPQALINRQPPHNAEAEQVVLGSMQVSARALGEITAMGVTDRAFYRPAHATIYRAALRLQEKGDVVDPITLAAELTSTGDLGRVGGAGYLHRLVDQVPTAAHAAYYADILLTTARWRELADLGVYLTQMAYRQEGDPDDARDEAERLLHSIGRTATGEKTYLTMAEVLAEAVDDQENPESAKGVTTGLTDLDRLTNGFQPGQMITVGARPAMGKSALAEGFVLHAAAESGVPSVFFSLEMSSLEIGQRALSEYARVALHHLRNHELTEDEWARIHKKLPTLAEAPVYVDTRANLTINEICSTTRRMHTELGIGIAAIDYLQLVTSEVRRGGTRQEVVSDISRKTKLLAKELEIPVIALAQLNRGPEQRESKKPMVSDLRESGSLEQDSDMVILLHREDAYEKESPRAGEADLIVAKHRNGPTAEIAVAFQGHYSRFRNMTSE